VVEAVMGGQLGGRVERCWEPEGLVCQIELPLARALADECSADAPLHREAAGSGDLAE
jgi:hypothetical protein